MRRKGLFGVLAAAAVIHLMGVAILLFAPPANSCPRTITTAEVAPTWKAFDHQTVDPQWEKFKKDHRGYEFWETEIYRGGERSINRFYLEN